MSFRDMNPKWFESFLCMLNYFLIPWHFVLVIVFHFDVKTWWFEFCWSIIAMLIYFQWFMCGCLTLSLIHVIEFPWVFEYHVLAWLWLNFLWHLCFSCSSPKERDCVFNFLVNCLPLCICIIPLCSYGFPLYLCLSPKPYFQTYTSFYKKKLWLTSFHFQKSFSLINISKHIKHLKLFS